MGRFESQHADHFPTIFLVLKTIKWYTQIQMTHGPRRTRLNIEIIECAVARQRGLPRYFTGGACLRGHVDERYVCNSRCVTCMRNEAREAARLRVKLTAGHPKPQDGLCDCCLHPTTEFHCDHDHVTGKRARDARRARSHIKEDRRPSRALAAAKPINAECGLPCRAAIDRPSRNRAQGAGALDRTGLRWLASPHKATAPGPFRGA